MQPTRGTDDRRTPERDAAFGKVVSSGTPPHGPGFIGRQRELAFLIEAVTAPGPTLVSVYGPAGVGKSVLVARLAEAAAARGLAAVVIDGRGIEPTPQGFLAALGGGLGRPAGMVTADLRERTEPLLLVLDAYDRLWLLDDWLREAFVPALSGAVRVVIAGRRQLGRGWRFAPERAASLRMLPLRSLSPEDAAALLRGRGVAPAEAESLAKTVGGHPLALHLVGSLAPLERNRSATVASGVIQDLAELFLEEISDPTQRHAVEAGALVRRLTVGLLRAMLPQADAEPLLQTLRALPLFETGPDGLVMHEAVRGPIAAALRAADPARARAYERAAWRHLRAEARVAEPAARWGNTADMVFLLRNPATRNAFFPVDAQPPHPEGARPADRASVVALVERRDSPAAARIAAAWLERDLDPFRVVRSEQGVVEAVYWAFDPYKVDYRLIEGDPVALAWWRHLRSRAGAGPNKAIFARRLLCRKHGEGYCPEQAACWLDIKRLYMDMRPTLRWVYGAFGTLEGYRPVLESLGFRQIADLTVAVGDSVCHTVGLDMGEGSFDAWIGRVVAAELGAVEDRPLDPGAREMVIDGRRIPLTPMEMGVLGVLHAREGCAVSRDDLLDEVWGPDWDGSSNVVEAVIKSLRRKLGPNAGRIRTVRGLGYMYRE